MTTVPSADGAETTARRSEIVDRGVCAWIRRTETPDGPIFEAFDVGPVEKFSLDFLHEGDDHYLSWDGQSVRLTVDNGSWVWKVIDVDHELGVVTGRWPD